MDRKQFAARVAAFFEGRTTLDQEEELYRAFRAGDYPEEMERYRALFVRLGAMKDRSTVTVPRHRVGQGKPTSVPPIEKRGNPRPLGVVVAAVTAAVLLVLIFLPPKGADGSYVRSGGRFRTDPVVIGRVAERLETDFDRYDREMALRVRAFERFDALPEMDGAGTAVE